MARVSCVSSRWVLNRRRFLLYPELRRKSTRRHSQLGGGAPLTAACEGCLSQCGEGARNLVVGDEKDRCAIYGVSRSQLGIGGAVEIRC